MNLSKKNQEDILNIVCSLKQEMLDFTIKCANINSGSFNVDGLNNILQVYKHEFSKIKDCLKIEEISLEPLEIINSLGQKENIPVGKALSVIKQSKTNNKKLKILFVGHLDTVFPIDSGFQKVKFIDDNTINGPGVADMKGGITLILYALKLLEQSPYAEYVDWEVLLNPDEEIGSWSSGYLLEKAAKRNDVGLIYEPSADDKGLFAGSRKGSGDFTLIAKGVASHAGRHFDAGKNAIVAMAKVMDNIYSLNGQRDGVTINIGKIVGGSAINVVPDLCVTKIGVRYPNQKDENWVKTNIEDITHQVAKDTGVSFETIAKFSRKPKHIIDDTKKLYELVKDAGSSLDIPVKWEATGGCCDGNNLFEHGLPNIDTMGVRGAKIHTADEYMIVDSLSERLRLTLATIFKLTTEWQAS